MAGTYLNTGILGQVSGQGLGIGGLSDTYREFKSRVQANRLSIAGISEAELAARRQRRDTRIADAVQTTGVPVDTADVKVPAIPGDTPSAAVPGITSPAVTGQATALSTNVKKNLVPDLQYSAADLNFLQGLTKWDRSIQSKAANDVTSGAGRARNNLQSLQTLAERTGNQTYIEAVAGIQGILGQKNISAKNVGTAKSTTNAALAKVRETLDIERIMMGQTFDKNALKSVTAERKAALKAAKKYKG